MSECSKYQLLLQTDYIRLREKYEHLYIYSYILSYIALMESSQLFLKQNMLVPSETVIERNSTGFTVKCENDCPVGCSDGCCKTIAVCEAVVDRNPTGFTVKCENYCPVEWHGLTTVVRQLLPVKQ